MNFYKKCNYEFYRKINSNRIKILFLFFCVANLNSQVRFPYNIDFRTEVQPPGTVLPVPSQGGINSAQFTMDGLLLTPADVNRFGGILLDDISFDSTNGIIVEFEFSMYGSGPTIGADGISMFLYDASMDPSLGSNGAALGYFYTRYRDGVATDIPGVLGGYLGIGIDAYGNYNNRAFQDYRFIGVPDFSLGSTITLRGAMHPDGLYGEGGNRGIGFSGYPVLVSVPFESGDKKYVLNNNGDYDETVTGGIPAQLTSTGLSSEVGDANYRKITVTLLPHEEEGYYITVVLQSGMTDYTLIDKFHYKTELIYTENANSNGFNIDLDEYIADTKHTLNAKIPAEFKIGFAASTGGYFQNQLINTVKVDIPYRAETNDDYVNACYNKIKVDLYANDSIYNGSLSGTPSKGNSSSYIDFSSFRFEDASGNILGDTSYTQDGVGLWKYLPATGELYFTPERGFVGIATTYYTVKGLSTNGGPFGQESYRSQSNKIDVKVINCNGLSNPHIISKP